MYSCKFRFKITANDIEVQNIFLQIHLLGHGYFVNSAFKPSKGKFLAKLCYTSRQSGHPTCRYSNQNSIQPKLDSLKQEIGDKSFLAPNPYFGPPLLVAFCFDQNISMWGVQIVATECPGHLKQL